MHDYIKLGLKELIIVEDAFVEKNSNTTNKSFILADSFGLQSLTRLVFVIQKLFMLSQYRFVLWTKRSGFLLFRFIQIKLVG